MKNSILRNLFLSAAFAATFAAAVPAASASVLMIDFGPTTVSGTSLTNSPYHTVNPLFSGTTWYQAGPIQPVADIAANTGLVYSDGSAATGVAINFGSTSSNTTINLNDEISRSNALGGGFNYGIYTPTSVGTDAVWDGGSSGSNLPVGMQISGLAAGSYDIYMTSRNTQGGLIYTQTLYAAASGTTGNFNFAGYSTSVISYDYAGPGGTVDPVKAQTTAWTLNRNYSQLNVTIGSGQVLNLAVQGGGDELRGFMNSLQIVAAVPEPGTFVMLLGGLGMLTLLRRRRA